MGKSFDFNGKGIFKFFGELHCFQFCLFLVTLQRAELLIVFFFFNIGPTGVNDSQIERFSQKIQHEISNLSFAF